MPTEFFNHLHVGDVQRYTSELLVANGIYFDDAATSIVVPSLLALKNSNGTIGQLKNKASDILSDNNHLIDTLDKYIAAFPSYLELIDKLEGYGPLDLATFNSMSSPAGPYSEKDLWDSLLIQYTLNGSLQLLEVLQGAVKIYRLRAKVGNASITTVEELSTHWNESFLVLPSPLFPLPFDEYTPPTGTTLPPATVDPAYAQVSLLAEARHAITASFNSQNEALKSKKMSAQEFSNSLKAGLNENLQQSTTGSVSVDEQALYQEYTNFVAPDFLDKDRINLLDQDQRSAMQTIGADLRQHTVKQVLDTIDRETGRLLKRVNYNPQKRYVTSIGSTLLEIDRIGLEEIICKEDASLDHCALIHHLNRDNPDTSLVQVLGTGYVNVIRQELAHYATGELAHIENILKGETKGKKHRNLKRTEDFSESSSSRTQESETDQRSSERFEMNKATSQVTSNSTSLQAGVSITAGYGPVSVTAGLNYASSSAATEAQSQSVNISKEVTNRAVERIKETVEERRSHLSINEIEIVSEHGIDNTSGTDHINGFYYWVDKVYRNQVVNKGKRLMLEFMVPEPAAFHIYSKSTSQAEGVNIEKPIAPEVYKDERLPDSLNSFEDITRDNYHFWGSVYGVQDLPMPPSDYETVSEAFALDYVPESKTWHDIAINSLKIPQGYKADFGKLNIGFSSGSDRYIAGYLGNQRFSRTYGTMTPMVISLDGERDIVPFSFRGHFAEYHMNVEIFCSLTPEKETAWKQQVYQSIITAYNQQLSDYENSLTLLSINQGIAIEGDNPRANRETEKLELKKWGIEMLTLQRFGQFNAMHNASNGHPEVNFKEAYEDGSFVKFFEQAIEWHNMTYIFYPYFWGRKPRWTVAKQMEDADPMFTKFLQAGYARVVVPVHPKFTRAMMHYLSSGEIWQGQGLPSIDDPLYLSVVAEIQAAENNTDGKDVGDPWEVTVPTNMIMLTGAVPPNLPGS